MIRFFRRIGMMVRYYLLCIREERALLDQALRHALISDADAEARMHQRGRASNPKWDDPIFGFETFSEAQKRHLRATARDELAG